MENREARARELFLQGYNCAQAVAGAFAEEVGVDFETLVRTASAFGGGLGRLRETCGTVSATGLILGLKYGYTSPGATTEKMELYARVQELAGKFREANGSIVCRELLGLPHGAGNDPKPEARTAQYYARRPCAEYCACAARILSEYIAAHPEGQEE